MEKHQELWAAIGDMRGVVDSLKSLHAKIGTEEHPKMEERDELPKVLPGPPDMEDVCLQRVLMSGADELKELMADLLSEREKLFSLLFEQPSEVRCLDDAITAGARPIANTR